MTALGLKQEVNYTAMVCNTTGGSSNWITHGFSSDCFRVFMYCVREMPYTSSFFDISSLSSLPSGIRAFLNSNC